MTRCLGLAIVPLLFAACDPAPTEAETAQVAAEESALGPACPTAPDTRTWRFGWQTVHGPIGAVWSSGGEVVLVEHVYEFREGWGVLIPSATRRDCYRVNVGGARFVESPGQPSSLDVFAMLPPGDVVLTVRAPSGAERFDVASAGGVRWSLPRAATACGDLERLIPSPDAERLVLARVERACPGSPVASGARVTLRRYDRGGHVVTGDHSVDLGAGAFVAWDAAGSVIVSDGALAFRWRDDGLFEAIPAPSCNADAPTTSSRVDAHGRTIFWNGGAPEISAPGAAQPFGCL